MEKVKWESSDLPELNNFKKLFLAPGIWLETFIDIGSEKTVALFLAHSYTIHGPTFKTCVYYDCLEDERCTLEAMTRSHHLMMDRVRWIAKTYNKEIDE